MKFPLIPHVFIECLLSAKDCAKHWGCNRDQQTKDSGSLESAEDGLHSVRNRSAKSGTVETLETHITKGNGLLLSRGSKLLGRKREVEKRRMNRSKLL